MSNTFWVALDAQLATQDVDCAPTAPLCTIADAAAAAGNAAVERVALALASERIHSNRETYVGLRQITDRILMGTADVETDLPVRYRYWPLLGQFLAHLFRDEHDAALTQCANDLRAAIVSGALAHDPDHATMRLTIARHLLGYAQLINDESLLLVLDGVAAEALACPVTNRTARARWWGERAAIAGFWVRHVVERAALDAVFDACETHLATNPLPDASFKLARARHDVAGVMGDDEGAARELAVMPQYVGPTKLVNQLTYFRSRGSLALKRGDAADALADLQSALALAEEIEAPAPFMLSIGLQLALTHLGQRQFADARAVLAKTRERTQQASWHYVDALHGVSTSLHLWNEDRPLALQSLREGLAIYRQRGRIMFLDAVPPVASLVAARALAADIERHFVEEAIRRRGLPPPNATVEDWPWAVRLRLFGGFAIERPGNETPATARRGKSQLRPIAILRALALLGPRGGDRRALARRVWRGEDPDDQADALDMAIGRARKLIGDDTLVRIQDGRFFLDASRVYVDAWALNDIERIATDARHQQVPLLALQDLGEQLIDIYQGRLLDDDDSMAASAVLIEQYRERFIATATLIAELLAPGQLRAATVLLQRAIEREPYSERLYRVLIELLARAGEYAEAMRWYRRCQHAVSQAYGVAVAPSTDALLALIHMPPPSAPVER